MAERLKLPIEFVARHLIGLDKTPQVRASIIEQEDAFTNFVIDGYGELIRRFNSLRKDFSEMSIMPGVLILKRIIGDYPVPTPELVSARDLVLGVKEAVPLMLKGQQIKKRAIVTTEEDVRLAIGTPSMNTADMALAVGAAGHILERSFFSHMRRYGIEKHWKIEHDWKRDDFLHPLVEVSLLKHAEAMHGYGEDAILFPLLANPNEEGGLGWIKQKQVDSFLEDYQKMIENPTLLERYDSE